MRPATRAPKLRRASLDQVVLREATEKDLTVCARILHTREVAGANDWYPSARVLRGCLGKFFLVAEENGRVVGCCVVEPLRYGVIGWWFAVAKAARGRGIGSALLREEERVAKREGKHFFLIYSKAGSKAVQFYRQRGYEAGQDFTELIKQL